MASSRYSHSVRNYNLMMKATLKSGIVLYNLNEDCVHAAFLK